MGKLCKHLKSSSKTWMGKNFPASHFDRKNPNFPHDLSKNPNFPNDMLKIVNLKGFNPPEPVPRFSKIIPFPD